MLFTVYFNVTHTCIYTGMLYFIMDSNVAFYILRVFFYLSEN